MEGNDYDYKKILIDANHYRETFSYEAKTIKKIQRRENTRY